MNKQKFKIKDDPKYAELYAGSIKDYKSDNGPYNFSFTFADKGKHKIKVKATNEAGKSAEREIEVSVGEPWKD